MVILLIGKRYGGRYAGTAQSITWREYDEARRLRLPVIVLVHRDVTLEALRTARARRAARAVDHAADFDTSVLPFLDAVRSARDDNWIHGDWDGSLSHLRSCVEGRLNSLFVAYQRPFQQLQREAERIGYYAEARFQLDSYLKAGFEVLSRDHGKRERQQLMTGLLELLELHREVLLSYEPNDVYNLAVYERRGEALHVFARRADRRVRRRNRAWPVGTGWAGLAVQRGTVLISRNLRHSEGAKLTAADRGTYVSAVCVPIGDPRRPNGVLVATSNRPDHFRDSAQVACLTAQSVALMLEKWVEP